METQTHFNLTTALDNWRRELSAQSILNPDERRELETHLSDSLAELQRRGLSDEESFWLARHRVGQPKELNEEFAKANSIAVWRKRVLWMASAVLVVSLWSVTSNIFSRRFLNSMDYLESPLAYSHYFWQNSSVRTTVSFLFRVAPLFVVVILLLRGTGRIFSFLETLFQSRARFVFTAFAWLVLNESSLIFYILGGLKHPNSDNGLHILGWGNLIPTLVWPLALVLLIAWLMTPQEHMTANHS